MRNAHAMIIIVALVLVPVIGSSLIVVDAAQIAFAQNTTGGENTTDTNQTGGNITMMKIGIK